MRRQGKAGNAHTWPECLGASRPKERRVAAVRRAQCVLGNQWRCSGLPPTGRVCRARNHRRSSPKTLPHAPAHRTHPCPPLPSSAGAWCCTVPVPDAPFFGGRILPGSLAPPTRPSSSDSSQVLSLISHHLPPIFRSLTISTDSRTAFTPFFLDDVRRRSFFDGSLSLFSLAFLSFLALQPVKQKSFIRRWSRIALLNHQIPASIVQNALHRRPPHPFRRRGWRRRDR